MLNASTTAAKTYLGAHNNEHPYIKLPQTHHQNQSGDFGAARAEFHRATHSRAKKSRTRATAEKNTAVYT